MNQQSQYAATLLRLSLALMFLAHAWLKLVVFTPAGTAQFFSSLGLPGALAYLTIAAELLGGIALLVGFKTRLVAAGLIPVLLGALFMVHAGNGWSFSNQGGGWEYPLFLVMASLVQILLGDGAFAFKPKAIFTKAVAA
ncbi:DoxX family protein [Agarivorans sp. MS3-6]|uniref:DoxX family protein n=1 Tax=Agarivorans sp. TSD2052 TaxID=2937286 RepID=UPI002010808C|nr:DoxX family protein [Agarivorans sp. TSD2052]UPW17462.1 DoxX family protein [Agarivorans sp. TSD2052]